jgi:hypothetical protein
MIFKSSVEKSQRSGAQFYRYLAQVFESNQLIRDTWAAMSHDLEQQASSLVTLPPSLWKRLKVGAEPLLAALKTSMSAQPIEKNGNSSLHSCFERTLDLEEPLILKAYVPIIRQLRGESTDRALEFYIMVKAHVNRLLLLIQPFEGDPGVLQRVVGLQEKFEREVQAPDPAFVMQTRRRLYAAVASTHRSDAKKAHKPKASARTPKGAKKRLRLGNRPLPAKRGKPLVGKLELRRSRARG